MTGRNSTVLVENFYRDPLDVRRFALAQPFYLPYEEPGAVAAGQQRPSWWATVFRRSDACAFKSSETLIQALETAVGEVVDRDHWRLGFPVDDNGKPAPGFQMAVRSCLWNCAFHVKPDNGQRLGDGVHNHVTDRWNGVGPDGWAGIIYLSPDAPLDGGLLTWTNVRPENRFDWMTPAENWQMLDRFGNVFNRLVMTRGDVPHSGAAGWSDSLQAGRLFQTFFFKTLPARRVWPVYVTLPKP